VPDAWEVLGVPPGTPHQAVRARWLALCKELHPDRHGDPLAARRLAEVNAAYSSLAGSRGEHDRSAATVATVTFPDVFEALLEAACDVGDVTRAVEPSSIDMRVGAGWAHLELRGDVLTVDTMHADADAVCDEVLGAMLRYLGRREGGR
jgi:hypothetical protein